MNGRIVWFVAGSVAGAYASVKARRAAYRMSMPGLIDQAAALGEGVRAFSDEVREGMDARTRQLEGELHLVPPPDAPDALENPHPQHRTQDQKDHRP